MMANSKRETEEIYTEYMETPFGVLEIVCSDRALKRLDIVRDLEDMSQEKINSKARQNHMTEQTKGQLQDYFRGERKTFDLELDPDGTAFQKRVWQSLLEIPYGETISYKTLAEWTGNGNGSRAVGHANSKNPIMIVIPCHRVIGANGKLTGYAGGLEVKAWLLQHEHVILPIG